VLRQFLPS